jgi:hypothetical protein
VGNGDNYTRHLTLFTLSVSGTFIEVNLEDHNVILSLCYSQITAETKKCRWEEVSPIDVLLKKLVMRN